MRAEQSFAGAAGSAKRAGTVPLLLGFLGGPICWTLHLVLSEVLVSLACAGGSSGFHARLSGGVAVWQAAYGLLFVVLAAATVSAGLLAFSSWRAARRPPAGQADETRARRSAWMAAAGMLLSTLFLIAIVFNAAPLFWFGGCG